MCSHQQLIEDPVSATLVCSECNVVLEENLAYEHTNGPRQFFAPSYSTSSFTSNEAVIRNELLDVLAVIHQDSGFIVDLVIADLEKHVKIEDVAMYNQTHRGILAFILWDVLNRQQIARSPQDIAYIMDTTSFQMQKAERQLAISPTYSPPSTFVPRICSALNIQYFPTMRMIEEITSTVDYFMHKPETVVGGVVLGMRNLMCSRLGINTEEDIETKLNAETIGVVTAMHLKELHHITAPYICSKLPVSQSSLTNILSTIDNEVGELIHRKMTCLI